MPHLTTTAIAVLSFSSMPPVFVFHFWSGELSSNTKVQGATCNLIHWRKHTRIKVLVKGSRYWHHQVWYIQLPVTSCSAVDISGSSQDPSSATKISGMSFAPGSQGGFVNTCRCVLQEKKHIRRTYPQTNDSYGNTGCESYFFFIKGV